jgi:hypothetical protein
MSQEALDSLKALGAELRLQLLELPEYRALSVVERTIKELTEILTPPLAFATDGVEAKTALVDLPIAAGISRIQPPAEVTTPTLASGQSRMAKAIADTIAARAAAFSGTAQALERPLNAA